MKYFVPAIVGFDCPMYGKYHTLTVNIEEYYNYLSGALVQDAFPKMSPTDRERFISGLCPDCQKELFKEY